jgi:hypothetical protein
MEARTGGITHVSKEAEDWAPARAARAREAAKVSFILMIGREIELRSKEVVEWIGWKAVAGN